MAKFVCDTDQVFAVGDKICKVATDMNTVVSSYASSSETSLEGWTGYAKNCFHNVNEGQVEAAKVNATYINAVGEFVKECAKGIQNLEEELASLDI